MQNLGAAHANLDQKVYQILKTMIMERKLLPGEKIRQEKLAQELGCDLIVMPTEGHQGILDMLRGSTTERVLRRAPCPVLAVPAARLSGA